MGLVMRGTDLLSLGGRGRQGALEVCLHPMKEAEEPSQRQLELGTQVQSGFLSKSLRKAL